MMTSSLELRIPHASQIHRGKVTLIAAYLERGSSAKTQYALSIDGDELVVSPPFRTEQAFKHVQNGIGDILAIDCDELDNQGDTCSEHYNCCDCGGNQCGCRGCFSCNACHLCTGEEPNSE
ncbi:hypothetical protein IC617_08530 [Neiella sp. HB171785]|uniref:Uncharacterized protein n=1 Tax=Neiella litorisoli TaxID=2771431 RepID=A0A8J6QJU2_9GAMM|nr:hypothetical protein [Neiella litorisoli]MBD1389471.1 hypothetical protein [Neiella litorisoli]